MKPELYFDTEFTAPIKDTDLISIGITTDDGRQFYAELTDYDITKAPRDSREWLANNVLNQLLLRKYQNNSCAVDKENNTTYVKGETIYVRKKLWEWLDHYKHGIQLVSDCGQYDLVLLQCLLSDNPVSLSYDFIQLIDLNQILMDAYNIDGGAAADLSRAELSGIEGSHNALSDAIQIKKIYNKLMKPINHTEKFYDRLKSELGY
jgi:hypothetical protein